jgi:hypothetical protein
MLCKPSQSPWTTPISPLNVFKCPKRHAVLEINTERPYAMLSIYAYRGLLEAGR